MKISRKLIENKRNIIKELYSDGKCELALRFYDQMSFFGQKIEVIYHFQVIFDVLYDFVFKIIGNLFSNMD